MYSKYLSFTDFIPCMQILIRLFWVRKGRTDLPPKKVAKFCKIAYTAKFRKILSQYVRPCVVLEKGRNTSIST